MLKKYIVYPLFLLLVFACRTHRTNLPLKQIAVSYIGDCNYEKESNNGSIDISIDKTDKLKNGITLKSKFDSYSPGKKPITMSFTECNNLVLIYNQKGKKFILGNMNEDKKNCNSNCQLNLSSTDKVSFQSSLGLFPYWHGLEVLGGLSLFMRYHYYTLKIKKKSGEILILEWKYSIYKYRDYNTKKLVWSGDYCEDNGGGLTKLKIK